LQNWDAPAVDSVLRLLKSISAPQAIDVEKQRQDVLRLLSQEQARHEIRTIPVSPAEEARILSTGTKVEAPD
jgi:hypothetical protein